MSVLPAGFAALLLISTLFVLWWMRGGPMHRARPAMAVILTLQGLVSLAFFAALPEGLRWGWAALHPFVVAYALTFIRPGEKSLLWDILVGAPAGWAMATAFLSLPWALAALLIEGPLPAWSLWWAPAALAAWGLVQTLWARPEQVELRLLGGDGLDSAVSSLARRAGAAVSRRRGRAGALVGDRLRIVQLTDTHIGAFMSAERLRRQCARALEAAPDLILLTGDFLTLASQQDPGPLAAALAPLRAHPAVFAVFGNHDHESPGVIRSALDSAGVTLLNDAHAVVSTRLGPVEVAGVDFRFSQRAEAVAAVLARLPPPEGVVTRLLMLHDPGMFRFVPEERFDLTLSGHTHGGQVGLLSFGLPITVVSALSSVPDHGPWRRGRGLLYVHRGTGHYGFPIRVGVPSEDSVLDVVLPPERLGLAAGAPRP